MPADKSPAEEEYFARLEREALAKAQAEHAAKAAVAARADRKALHAGKCGKCGGSMGPKDFQGVEIDICGDCGSVLLDPGELETLAGHDAGGIFKEIGSFLRGKGK